MATRAGTYLPIRPAGYKPAPVPYFKELMAAQNMLPVGILAAAASAGDDDEKKKPAGVAVSTPAVPPPDEDPLNKLEGIKTLTERVISQEVEKLPGGREIKQMLSIIKEVPSDPDEREKFYAENVGDIQRGKAENAMLRINNSHAGVLSPALENIGDLTHRITQLGDTHRYGSTEEKVRKMIMSLDRSDWGIPMMSFLEEHEQNIKNNAKYDNIPIEEYKDNLNALLTKYVEEHKKIPTYNELQENAKQAAIAIGNLNVDKALQHLRFIQKEIDKGQESFDRKTQEFFEDKLPGGQEVKQLELFDDLQEIAKIRPEKSKIDEKVIGEYFPDENYGLEENIDWAEALDRSQTDINNFVDGLIKGEVDLRVNQYIKADKLMQEVKEEMFVGDEPLEPIGDILGIIDVERPDPILRFLEEGLIDKLQSLETNKYTQMEVVAHELGHIAGNQWEMINTNEVLRLSRDIQEDVKNNYPTIMTKHTFERAKKLIKKMKKKDYFDDSELVREVFADEASQMPAIREAAKKLLNAFTPRELFPREIKTRTRKNMGGLVGISHLTRPL